MIYILVDLYLFFILYVASMGMIRAHNEGKLNWFLWALCLPFVTVSVIVNIIHNVTIVSLLFWELPKEWTVSTRMKRHYNSNDYRGKISRWLCATLLNPFDHTGDHCD